ncbi:PucR family transcriptional regulator [Mycobacteroides abscessus]|uniref:PucR family transcriptional regulator n=1 Tax=Mycobacteroides abscessus TaxID=36809 RepID=A0ABD7HHY9_9MYCO|nr:PucR family transcriptional regulator [Mycobacteroides abscessus]PVA73715.1 PucR family transcriptional regulator [Mycobacteroides abscessus]PVB11945.1 PucR family transcriptional regulator [Mycobacteroides abscessus]PVB16638.1 PucR family transcriptional regulator [Mycobacteroides abscessus]RIR41887.1 PucR family transcriptional regulator [Mycobacteroides abscessus]
MHWSGGPWPVVSERTKELFRRGAELALTPSAADLAELQRASLAGLHSQGVLDDPTLFESIYRTNVDNLRHWAASNISNPAERVVLQLGQEAINIARDLVRRGLDRRSLDSYRMSQSVAWRSWMDICFSLTSDASELKELLDISALSISTFLDDIVEEVTALVDSDIKDLAHGTNTERLATLALIVEGAPITRTYAENRLGYRLSGEHTALIIWFSTAHDSADSLSDGRGVATALEAVADALTRASNATRRLTLVGSTRSLWLWLPTSEVPIAESVRTALAATPGVYVAIGRGGQDIEGFRRSHLDAAVTQRMLARTTSSQRIARYEDVQLIALMAGDLNRVDEFIAETLGALVGADPEIRETIFAYIREGFNASKTAKRLYTHRNTVLRRLETADRLLPRALAENIINIAVALEVLRFRPEPR